MNIKMTILVLVIMSFASIGCSHHPPQLPPEMMRVDMNGYRLSTGDHIKLTIMGEDDLSGVYQIDGAGRVALPLIGNIVIRDQMTREAEAFITQAYARDYLKDPKVALQIVEYRPFYILGEVNKPGSYPYVDGLTVLNAVALGGGFTYRGNKNDIEIKRLFKRKSGDQTLVFSAPLDAQILPGDTITIDERLF